MQVHCPLCVSRGLCSASGAYCSRNRARLNLNHLNRQARFSNYLCKFRATVLPVQRRLNLVPDSPMYMMNLTKECRSTPQRKQNCTINKMIPLTRLNGHPLVINSDLIKLIENAPDTVISLVNGEKIVVRETVEQILERIVQFRRRVLDGLQLNFSGWTSPRSESSVAMPNELPSEER